MIVGPTAYQMTAQEGRLRSPQRTLKLVINLITNEKTGLESISFSRKQDFLYNARWQILDNTISLLLLLCCFYLLKELPYMQCPGFFGKCSSNLSSGFLLITSQDRLQRTGGKVWLNRRNFIWAMTKGKRRCLPPTIRGPWLGFS